MPENLEWPPNGQPTNEMVITAAKVLSQAAFGTLLYNLSQGKYTWCKDTAENMLKRSVGAHLKEGAENAWTLEGLRK